MKLLLVHNEYGRYSGEETIFHGTVDLLRAHGHDVRPFVRSSRDLPAGWRGKLAGFCRGIWSPRSRREFARECEAFRPDVVQIQNLYPLISPAILGEVRRRRLPLVMVCQNYRLFCPTGLMLREGAVCTECAARGEAPCVRHNCEGSMARSIGYALRNRVARPRLLRGVHQFVVLSSFQADRFAEWGVPRDRLAVVPNFIDAARFPLSSESPGAGDYVGFVGRLSPEKGVGVLFEAARRLPHIRFELAGHMERMPTADPPPANVILRGELSWADLPKFYRCARFMVVPSVWFEGFPLVVLEAMLQERAIVASRIGSLADIVVDQVTGRLVAAGDPAALATVVEQLWRERGRTEGMGREARARVEACYITDAFYRGLMGAYAGAHALAGAQETDGLSGHTPRAKQ